MNSVNPYLKYQTHTADPLEQIILLYEKAILLLKQVQQDIENNDIQSKNEHIKHCEDIIVALDSALDFEKGGEVAKNLHELYGFIHRSLLQVHIKNDKELAGDLIEILERLLEGWKGIQNQS